MLPKKNRLCERRNIFLVLKKGIEVKGRFFRLHALPKKDPEPRFAIIVNNKEGKKATERNYIKRRTREVVKNKRQEFLGYAVVIFAKKNTSTASRPLLAEELTRHAASLKNHNTGY